MRSGAFRPDVALFLQQPEDQFFCPNLVEDLAFGPRNMGLGAAGVAARVAVALADCNLTHLANRPVHQLSAGENAAQELRVRRSCTHA